VPQVVTVTAAELFKFYLIKKMDGLKGWSQDQISKSNMAYHNLPFVEFVANVFNWSFCFDKAHYCIKSCNCLRQI
jgi:hypothetical protein